MANGKLRSAVNLIAGMIAMLAPALSSCAGDDETPPADYSEACDSTTKCATNLVCIVQIGICTQACMTTQDCVVNLGSPASVCIGGNCQVSCDATEYMACSEYGVQCVQTSSGSTCQKQHQ